MALLGQAALAMWWEMAPDVRAEFEHWHAHEHYAERLALPGFRRGTRWSAVDGGQGIFQMYELDSHAVLSSPAYLERLNAPTPWSSQMMPHHRQMVRCQCHVLYSSGGGVARHALTLRLSPREGQDDALWQALARRLASTHQAPGIVGVHLLRHQRPDIAQTREQLIRGGDAAADVVLVVTGYERAALQGLRDGALSDPALVQDGAAAGVIAGLYLLCQSATPADMG